MTRRSQVHNKTQLSVVGLTVRVTVLRHTSRFVVEVLSCRGDCQSFCTRNTLSWWRVTQRRDTLRALFRKEVGRVTSPVERVSGRGGQKQSTKPKGSKSLPGEVGEMWMSKRHDNNRVDDGSPWKDFYGLRIVGCYANIYRELGQVLIMYLHYST